MVSFHGVFAGLGFAAGIWLIVREAERRRLDVAEIVGVLVWGVVGALIGMRVFTALAALIDGDFIPSELLSLSGRNSSLGGYAGGIAGGWLAATRARVAFVPLLDMAAPSLALGAVLARVGDLIIVEHLGSRTSFFLGYTLRPGYVIAPQHVVLQQACDLELQCGTYHNTALYDMVGAAVLFGVLWTSRIAVVKPAGRLFGMWLLWYSLQRFLIDFTRLEAAKEGTTADSVLGPLTGSQWGAAVGVIVGIVVLISPRLTDRANPRVE